MKIVEQDGTERKIGEDWSGHWGQAYQLLSVEEEGFFSGTAVLVVQPSSRHAPELVRVPLRVSYLNPKFPLQKVGVLWGAVGKPVEMHTL